MLRLYFYIFLIGLFAAAIIMLAAAIAYRRYPQHRDKAEPLLRKFAWGGLIVTMGMVIFVTNFPIPSDFEAYCALTGRARPNLNTFHTWVAFTMWFENEDNISFYRIVTSGFTIQFVLNLFMLAPPAFFLRAGWRHGVWTALVIGFATSLAIETTQLTGVWGLMPCPYRTFATEDLWANTLSALMGWFALHHIVSPFLKREDEFAASGDQPNL